LRGRRIASVDVAGARPQDEVIDLNGMTLLPGLITSHLHPDFYKYELTSGLRPGLERPPGVMMAIGVRTCRVLLESGFTGYSGAPCARHRLRGESGDRRASSPAHASGVVTTSAPPAT
jgi:cytosine/adenosine deaminase-related metal-dependent hydrolase